MGWIADETTATTVLMEVARVTIQRIALLLALILVVGCSSDQESNNANNTSTPDASSDLVSDAAGMICTPGERQCLDLVTSQLCNGDGTIWVDQECADGERCNELNGNCSEEICSPGSFGECTSTGLMRYCNVSGTEYVVEACPGDAPCEDGSCGEPECEPGTFRCMDKDQLEICNEAGARVPGARCPIGTECFNGECEELCELNKKVSSYIGCEYWSADLDNFDDALSQPHAIVVTNINPELTAEVQLFLGEGQELTTGYDGQPFQRSIPPGEAAVYSIPVGYDHSGTRVLKDKAIRVTANIPIIAYQFNPLNNVDVYSNDGTLLLPTNAIGNEYWGMSWPFRQGPGLRGFLTVVNSSGQPNRVTVRPTAQVLAGPDIDAIERNEAREFDLAPGESLNLTASGIEFEDARATGCLVDSEGPPENVVPCPDLTGTRITAEHPITVFGGHQCANVVQGVDRCDHVESVLFPVTAWGTRYLGTKFKPRAPEDLPEPDVWRVLAAEDGTRIQTDPPIDGVHGRTIDSGEWIQFEADKSFVFGADKPVSLAQYMVGSNWIGIPRICNMGIDANNPTGIGDPAMTMTVPLDQFRTDYLVLTPDAYEEDYINVVAPAGVDVRLDGASIPAGQWRPVGAQGAYEVAVMRVEDGFHQLEADQPFGIVAYGYDCHVSYAYPGGLNLEEITERP